MFTTTANPTLYVFLFSFSIVLTYTTVRRGWLHLPVATVVGIVYTSVSFLLYSLAVGNDLTHALSVGIALGTIFTVATVVIAASFRADTLDLRRETLAVAPKHSTINRSGDF